MQSTSKQTLLKLNSIILFCFMNLFQASAQNYGLVWSDEFDNPVINSANWTLETGTGQNGWGNNELQNYTNRPVNAVVQNGELQIIAKKENFGGSAYTSARLKTQNKKSWKYGKVEARMKLPIGQGLWPAFWMLGQNIGQVGWPQCGEIDIMERINNEAQVHGTIHWNDNGHVSYGGTKPVNGALYHTYSVEWTSTGIRWLLDGVQYWIANTTNSVNGTDEFHKSFFVLLNLAVGGDWPGSPNASTVFPDTLHVDYVRVYQAVTTSNGLSEQKEELQFFPNPASSQVTVLCSDEQIGKPYSIFNSTGACVLSGLLMDKSTTLKINRLPTGIYILDVQNNRKRRLVVLK